MTSADNHKKTLNIMQKKRTDGAVRSVLFFYKRNVKRGLFIHSFDIRTKRRQLAHDVIVAALDQGDLGDL